jgi:hypothetical protein
MIDWYFIVNRCASVRHIQSSTAAAAAAAAAVLVLAVAAAYIHQHRVLSFHAINEGSLTSLYTLVFVWLNSAVEAIKNCCDFYSIHFDIARHMSD